MIVVLVYSDVQMTSDLRTPRAPRSVRAARSVDIANDPTASESFARKRRILMVDLNNFSTFPTLAIGILVSALRNDGHQVRVICPLSHDVPAREREWAETRLDHVKRRIHLSTAPGFRVLRDSLRDLRNNWNEKPHPTVLREVGRAIEEGGDIILLSAYLQHFDSVREIGLMAQAAGVPVLLGGPMFNVSGVAEAWRSIPGIVGVVGAEAEHDISAMVDAVCEGRDLLDFAGVVLPDGRASRKAPPLRQLDRSPIPDFTDFPWDRYPVRIVPMMTGRGCQWDKCLFCSDVVSVSGRTFRTRSIDSVLLEMQEQSRRHDTTSFLFLDLKLNSYPDMIRGIAERVQSYVQGAEWIGSVHVDTRKDNGLSRADLRAAVAGGMRRISFGLETGSQRLLDLMRKGSSVERNSEFIRHAHEAGLSVRCTMFKGFPGETTEDMVQTAEFLEAHAPYLDRVRFNEFSLLEDTPIYDEIVQHSGDGPFSIRQLRHRKGRAEYINREGGNLAYRRAKARALRSVYEINRRPLRMGARQFDGLM